MSKKIISCMLALLLLMMMGNGLFKNQALAARSPQGTYSGGTGTDEDTLLVSNVDDLIEMKIDLGGSYYYELTQMRLYHNEKKSSVYSSFLC